MHISTTITIRTDPELREALRKRAEEEGMTLSAYVRSLLERELSRGPLRTAAGHLRGRLRLTRRTSDSWREQIRQRNWRS